MKITVNNQTIECADNSNLFEIAKCADASANAPILCAKVNGNFIDMRTQLDTDSNVEFFTFEHEEGKKAYRHSASHVLAQAVLRIYPDTKVAIGPAISNGFYYDFEFSTPISMSDLPKIEMEMKKIIKDNYPIVKKEISYAEALAMFANEPYKIELIEGLEKDAIISIYTQQEFSDLCAGPHLPSTGYIKAYKLTAVTGAYWRGDEKNKMLTRIYGTAFDNKANLEQYLLAVEEAKKRDHNKLGRELGIFMTDENIGQGLPLFMPKGAKLFQLLTRFVEDEEERRGYLLTKTPYMAKKELYQISGHWDHYKDGMFVMGDEAEKDAEVFALRPMTCPFQYTIYNNGLKSYRDLPIRYSETSTLFRNESSGEMHGLIRVRQFTISEAHLVCTPSQLEQEFKGALDLAIYMLKSFGLHEDVSFRFSKWDANNRQKYIYEPKEWEYAQAEMERILQHICIKYSVGEDEAAFYGPKLDIQIKNVHGKEDTLITIQIDMFLAKRFNMTYVDENGEKKHPYIIHRTSMGCYERTIALLIEKYAGAFPTWMSPTQVKVLALTDRTSEDVISLAKMLKSKNIRAEYDIRSEKIGYKIREAQLEKVPYMIIIGDKEKENNVVAVRDRKKGDLGIMPLEEFLQIINRDIEEKLY